jgi:hypothetical protein
MSPTAAVSPNHKTEFGSNHPDQETVLPTNVRRVTAAITGDIRGAVSKVSVESWTYRVSNGYIYKGDMERRGNFNEHSKLVIKANTRGL